MSCWYRSSRTHRRQSRRALSPPSLCRRSFTPCWSSSLVPCVPAEKVIIERRVPECERAVLLKLVFILCQYSLLGCAKNPSKAIPKGTISAVGVTSVLYTLLVTMFFFAYASLHTRFSSGVRNPPRIQLRTKSLC